MGARSLLRPEKKVLVICLAGAWSLLRPEKKFLVVCLAGARCIEFECNEFVLVLVQIDLIHFEHSICISSTWIKTDTNPLVQLKLKLMHICYRTDLHIEVQIRILLKDKKEIVSKMQNLQPYSHYCFSKISRTLFDILNNTYWVSLF